MTARLSIITIVLSLTAVSLGAVGCTLNDPDRDIIRLFPDATNYKNRFYLYQ